MVVSSSTFLRPEGRCTAKCTSSKRFIRVIRENPWPSLPFQEEFGQLHVRRSRDLDISRRTHHYHHGMSRALDQRSFVRAEKPVRGGLVKRFFQNAVFE